jgi:hypothetical protein
MDYKIVGLGIIAIILIYVLYQYYTSSITALAPTTSLLQTNTAISILKNPSSYNYTYSAWIYVNNWNWNKKMPIYYRDYVTGKAQPDANFVTGDFANQGANTINNSMFMLYLDASKPILYCQVPEKTVDNAQPFTITSNFPIQNWTNVVVSVNSQYVDFYINGKLVKSVQMANIPQMPSATTPVYLGQGGDIVISGFTYTTSATSPQSVWTSYINGNPTSSSLSAYNINIDLVKNSAVQQTYTLF